MAGIRPCERITPRRSSTWDKPKEILENIHVQGFRRLYDVDLKPKPFNVVIGGLCGSRPLY